MHNFDPQIGPVGPHINAAIHLAAAAAAFPGLLYQKAMDTPYEMFKSIIPETVTAAFDRRFGHRTIFSRDGHKYPLYDGIDGYHPYVNEAGKFSQINKNGFISDYYRYEPRFIDSGHKLIRNPVTGAVNAIRRQEPTKLPFLPKGLFQISNAISSGKTLYDRAYHHKDSVFNRIRTYMYPPPNARKASMFNRKVKWTFRPGYITKSMRKKIQSMPRRKTRVRYSRKYKRGSRATYKHF